MNKDFPYIDEGNLRVGFRQGINFALTMRSSKKEWLQTKNSMLTTLVSGDGMKYLYILTLTLIVSGCMAAGTQHRPDSYYQDKHSTSPSSIDSVLSDRANNLSEESIQKILSYRLAIPAKNRVAILNLSPDNYWSYYSSSFVSLDKEMLKGLIDNLNESPRIYDASFLPSLLLPRQKTLAKLRMASARYQADVLLTYQTKCQRFEKHKLIDPNVIKAYCTVEAMAIDTRSGIVPFTAVSTNEFTAEKKESDVNFDETRKKAEMKAINAGLSEISSIMRKFIEGMPTLGVNQ